MAEPVGSCTDLIATVVQPQGRAQAGQRLDLIMIPKVGTAADVYAIDMMVTQIEAAKGFKKHIGFEFIIVTALGMQNIHEIAAASKRIESLHFGVADYAASTRARTTNIGGANPDYSILTDKDEQGARATHWGDMWHYALARMVVAAPSLPSHTAREASSSATMVTTASASIAASPGEVDQRAPRAIRSSALARLRFQTEASNPALWRFFAMGIPMAPRPAKPTRIIGAGLSGAGAGKQNAVP